jgi:predicted esterase
MHGTGCSAEIFRIQISRLRFQLRDEFDFIFMNGPLPAAPGPGVLPLYSHLSEFHGWFGAKGDSVEHGMVGVLDTVRTAVEDWERAQASPNAEIVGVIGFSEGALAATMMLWQQQLGLAPWLPKMQFAVLICCFFPNEAGLFLKEDAEARGVLEEGRALLKTPTLHVHGSKDFCLARARKLVRNHYEAKDATTVVYEMGHACPTRKEDCVDAANLILKLAKETCAI